MEMARCMLQGKKIEQKFWEEAVVCAAHIINRIPARVVRGMTPYEKWYGSKPFFFMFFPLCFEVERYAAALPLALARFLYAGAPLSILSSVQRLVYHLDLHQYVSLIRYCHIYV